MDRHVNWELLSTTDGLSCYRLVFVFWWIITRLSSGGPCCCLQLDHYFRLMDCYSIVHRHARPLVVTLASTDWFWSCRPQTGLCCCPVLRCHVTVYCGLFYCPQQVFTDHWEQSPSEQLLRYCEWRVNANVEWSLLLLSTVGCYAACDWTTLDCAIVRWLGRYVIVHVAVIQPRQETLYSYTTHTREGKDADGWMLKGSWREEKL